MGNIIKGTCKIAYKLIPYVKRRGLLFSVFVVTVYIYALASIGYLFYNKTYKYINSLTLVDPIKEANQLIAEDKLKDAKELLEFYSTINFFSSNNELTYLLADVNKKRSSLMYKTKEIAKGFIVGKSNESYGSAAAMASDMLVIGDIRDLVKEGNKYLHGEEINTVTASLATIGVILTGVEVAGAVTTTASVAAIPASGGASSAATVAFGTATAEISVAKSAMSIIKYINKGDVISHGMEKYIITLGKSIKACNSFKESLPLFEKIYDIYKSGGIKAASAALQYSDNLNDIKSFAIASVKLGNNSGVYFKLGGKDVAEFVNSQKYNKNILDQSLAFGKYGVGILKVSTPSKYEVIARGFKEYKKGEIIKKLAAVLSFIPWGWLIVLEIFLLLSFGKTIFQLLPEKIFHLN